MKAVRDELAAVGITVTVLPLTNSDFDNGQAGLAEKAARSDLIWGGGSATGSDPVLYLESLSLFLPPSDRATLARIARLSSPRRERRASALAAKLERASIFAMYADGALPTLVSRRLGCIVHQPEYAGVDLAALCLKEP